jgi:hypothetical protein
MYKPWKIENKHGDIQYPEGEVVYQTRGVVIEPLYVTEDNKWYILTEDGLQEVLYNGFNGYCYRQDGL